MKNAAAAIAAIALMGCATADAQQNTPPCAAPEFRQLDFWVGDWDVRWDAGGGVQSGRGTNRITREYDNCVIQEDFHGGPTTGNLIGHSVSTYHQPVQQWRQTWVDNKGGYFALVGGPEGDGFVLSNTRVGDSAPYLRMVWEDITADSLTWRWQSSSDAGATWSDQWVIYYTRRNP